MTWLSVQAKSFRRLCVQVVKNTIGLSRKEERWGKCRCSVIKPQQNDRNRDAPALQERVAMETACPQGNPLHFAQRRRLHRSIRLVLFHRLSPSNRGLDLLPFHWLSPTDPMSICHFALVDL